MNQRRLRRPNSGRQPHLWPALCLAICLAYPPTHVALAAEHAPTDWVDRSEWLRAASHDDLRTQHKYQRIINTAGSGLAVEDLDGDGDDDLVVLAGRGVFIYLQRNHTLQLTQAIDEPDATGLSLGICMADIDSDGDVDALQSRYGSDYWLINDGMGHFEQQPITALGAPVFSTSCAFADVDNDGDLDAYVARYAQIPVPEPRCGSTDAQIELVCEPRMYHGAADALLINDGEGHWHNEAPARGILDARGDRGFGVLAFDYQHDADIDFYVANDGGDNRLYVNNGNGQFADEALRRGVAVNLEGRPEAGMGIIASDFDGNGGLDLLVTHYAAESNTLYSMQTEGYFLDQSLPSGMAAGSFADVGWGGVAIDLNNDGVQEIVVANGHVDERIGEIQSLTQYKQGNALYLNDGSGRYEKRLLPGPAHSSRGMAWGDFNQDGRADVVVSNLMAPPTLLINNNPAGNWIGLTLVDPDARDLTGSRVTVQTEQRSLMAQSVNGGSYLSHAPSRFHFGLGDWNKTVEVTVTWPDQSHSSWKLAPNKAHRVQRPVAKP